MINTGIKERREEEEDNERERDGLKVGSGEGR